MGVSGWCVGGVLAGEGDVKLNGKSQVRVSHEKHGVLGLGAHRLTHSGLKDSE
jgi:hypothetical protein